MNTNLNPLIEYMPSAACCVGPELKVVADQFATELSHRNLPSPECRACCEVSPWLLSSLVKTGYDQLSRVISPLACACASLCEFESLPELADAALADGEAIEVLIRAAVRGDVRLPAEIDDYASRIRDPNRLFRLGYPDLAAKAAASAPGSTLSRYHSWYQSEEPAKAAPDGLTDEYAFRGALYLRALGAEPGLLTVTHPRWAYHILREGLAQDPVNIAQILEVLHRSPAWTAQYIKRVNMDPAESALHLSRCPKANGESLLLVDWAREHAFAGLSRPLDTTTR